MNWLTDVGKAVGDAAKTVAEGTVKAAAAVVDATVAPAKAVVDVVQGKAVDDAVKEAVSKQFGQVAAGLDLAATMTSLQQTVAQRTAASALGPRAADIIADIQRLSTPIDAGTAAAVAHGTEEFIKTGDINLLNPAAVLMAAEVTRCRDLLRPLAMEIPVDVVGVLPDELKDACSGVRVMERKDVPGALNAPTIAIKHLEKATAMTLIDVIVFDSIPGKDTDNARFYWAHELHHVAQYKLRGVPGFCAAYMGEELGFHAAGEGVNALEEEADLSACRHYPEAQPHYIAVCPVG